jgi:diguanylate cyclase (GGDEF)-like protein
MITSERKLVENETEALNNSPILASKTLWQRLTEPHASISKPEHRRRARMLSAMLIGVLGIGMVSSVFVYFNILPESAQLRQLNIKIIVFGDLFILGGYLLSRTAHAKLAATLTILGILATVFISVLADPTYTPRYSFLIFAGLVGGLFLSPLGTFIIFVLTTMGILTVPAFAPEIEIAELIDDVFFVFSVGGLVLLGALVRRLDIRQIEEQARQLTEREARLITAVQTGEEANTHLSELVAELEQRRREEYFLTEMADLLQASQSEEEALSVIHQGIMRLFPNDEGVLFVLNSSMNMVETAVRWGEKGIEDSVISASDCWALRRGRAYFIAAGEPGTPCKHLGQEAPLPFSSICLPMMAQSEALGTLHLRFQAQHELSQEASSRELDHQQKLAQRVADQISLAISNLRLRESLQRQAIRDPLTGLFNRRYLEETLEREIHRVERRNLPLSIMMLDLDHFKIFNDSYGHEAGDTLLREVGIFLRRMLRGEDTACRYGGEEFTLILTEASGENASLRAESIRDDLKHLNIHYRGDSLGGVTTSIGIATFPENGLTADVLLRAADQALYRAKSLGRDRVEMV